MRAQRAEIGVQCRQRLFQQPLERFFLPSGEEFSPVGAPEKESDFGKRTAGGAYEARAIPGRSAAAAFRDIRPDAVRRAHELAPDGAFREAPPRVHRRPDQAGEFRCHAMAPQIVQREFCHALPDTRAPAGRRPITQS